MATPMTLLELHDAIAKAIADAIGHGMREKCERHADAVLAVVGPQLVATAEHAERIKADEGAVPVGHFIQTSPGNWEQAAAMYAGQPGVIPLFPRLPAQAAQVDRVAQEDARAYPNRYWREVINSTYGGKTGEALQSRVETLIYQRHGTSGALMSSAELIAVREAAETAAQGRWGDESTPFNDWWDSHRAAHATNVHLKALAIAAWTASRTYHECAAQPRAVPDGWKLAMWVLQSDLYRKLPEEERAVCEALVAENPYIAAPSPGESA